MTGKPASEGPQETSFADVRIGLTHYGKGLFAGRDFPAQAVIGEIRGERIEDPGYGSEYAFDVGGGVQLEPHPPFRYVNHSCDPNCEFDWFDVAEEDDPVVRQRVYLIALRIIRSGEELTIDYNWPAENAIPCQCGTARCRGWIMAPEEEERWRRQRTSRT